MTVRLSLRDAADIRALAFAFYQQLVTAGLADVAQAIEAIRMGPQPPRDASEYLAAVSEYAEGHQLDLELEFTP